MFHFPLIARRAAKSKLKRSSARLQLEALEHRVVPTVLPNGTILFTNYKSTFDNNTDPTPAELTGILGIEGVDGIQHQEAVNTALAAGSTLFQKPSNLFEDPLNSNVVYVTDDGNFQGLAPGPQAAVLKVDFSFTPNPKVTIVSKAGYLFAPTGVVVIPDSTQKEWLYVTDDGNSTAQLGLGYVVRIDPITGAQTQLAGTVAGTWGRFQCPVSDARVYNGNPIRFDINHLWVLDQGGNQTHGFGPGVVWSVDLTNFNNNPTAFSQGGYLSVSSTNFALGNPQIMAVDPSSGTIYMPQYGIFDYAGSVVSVDSHPTQAILAQDDGMNKFPNNPQLGYYVNGGGWDPNYFDLGPRVITGALENRNNPPENTRGGHLEAVNPSNGTVSEVAMNPDQNTHSYIATPGGIITYSTASGAPGAGAGQGPASLGRINFSTPDSLDLSSLTSAPAGASSAIQNVETGPVAQALGVWNRADSSVAHAGAADGYWEQYDGTSVPASTLTDGFQNQG